MNTRRFFTDIDNRESVSATTVSITGDEYHHLRQVNRARPGDEVEVINGRGVLFYGGIRQLKPGEAVVDIKKRDLQEKPPVRLVIAPSLLKHRPMGILIEKLTEMGIDEIRPVIFNRTDEKYNPAKLKKWQKVAVQSLKVNKHLWGTGIFPPVSLEELIVHCGGDTNTGTRILLDIAGEPGLPAVDAQRSFPVTIVIGPPGDMTAEERELLTAHGFIPCNISDAVLKTETAALSIAAVMKHILSARQARKTKTGTPHD
jgi:16S rRNA (uracil1498-N3)-methyltransferase